MPSKNALKTYVDGGYYHVYNRGVNKMTIFADEKDYHVFLSYLKTYLLPKDIKSLTEIINDTEISPEKKDEAVKLFQLNNFHNKIDLLAYCLMSNHFHFLVKQYQSEDLKDFMKSLMTRYTQYFNKRQKRIGPLYQGRYKAVLVESEPQLLHLSRYIHRNSLDLTSKRTVPIGTVLHSQPSSYPNYLGEIDQAWVKPDFILENFSQSGFNSYKSFVESDDSSLEEQSIHTISKVAIDFQ